MKEPKIHWIISSQAYVDLKKDVDKACSSCKAVEDKFYPTSDGCYKVKKDGLCLQIKESIINNKIPYQITKPINMSITGISYGDTICTGEFT